MHKASNQAFAGEKTKTRPNIVFVFGDQWRQQATGYAGDPNVQTPHIDALAGASLNFTHAVAGCPVCSPYRASLLTGQMPMTHGVFVNDVYLQPNDASIAATFSAAGYDTAYIGKWHVDGHGRTSFIPSERRQGFDYWKVLECTHNYNKSAYYAGDSDEKLCWEGYDATAQTRDAEAYIRNHAGGNPFLLMLSWGPPHSPYNTAPEEYRAIYDPAAIVLRPNVPRELAVKAREWLAGYYAHCSALDACVGRLLSILQECSLVENTIFVFTSDHGDMLGSHGQTNKQRPWDESIRVPFLLRYPGLSGMRSRETDALINAHDIFPTLLGLCDIPVPATVQGLDFSKHIAGGADPSDGAALLECLQPFGQWNAPQHGGREYRGLRTKRYTYVRDRQGPWLLYDNDHDPFQMQNLISDREFSDIRKQLDIALWKKLDELNDAFLPGMDYIEKWGYIVDENGTVSI